MSFTLGGYFHHRAAVLGRRNHSLKCYPLRQHPFSHAKLFTAELNLPEVNDKQMSSFFSKKVANWCNHYHFINLQTPLPKKTNKQKKPCRAVMLKQVKYAVACVHTCTVLHTLPRTFNMPFETQTKKNADTYVL